MIKTTQKTSKDIKKMSESKLTMKQLNFVIHYFEYGNACEAYRYAYNTKKMKQITVEKSAWDLLHNPKVTTRLDELRQKLETDAILSKNEALKILSKIARGNLVEYIQENGEIDFVKLKQDGILLEEFTVTESKHGTNRKIKLKDQLKAISEIAKALGWYAPEKHEHTMEWNTEEFLQSL